jgi:hypothetical protein
VQCRVQLVSVTGCHKHLARRVHIGESRHLYNEAPLVHISAIYTENRGVNGWPRKPGELMKPIPTLPSPRLELR